ncbi:hypothetical protein BJZ21_003995 [Nocardioides panaciterrulae]|uniref:Uncharacterized protein n=1 Tax=Nocardioides panaciterrulae TaxID=661492 RepID=A0A7Y9JCH8_9ACTN|nr:hypothetical protein [Nocardioides panaciterrulae]
MTLARPTRIALVLAAFLAVATPATASVRASDPAVTRVDAGPTAAGYSVTAAVGPDGQDWGWE